jgi:Flp pilus assembly protein TadG
MTGTGFKLCRMIRMEWTGDYLGQALVETAFTVPLLLFLLLGAVEFGRVAFIGIEVSNAAKAAAQYGAQNNITANDQAGMQAVAQADASALPAGSVVVTVSSVCSCSSPYSASPSFSCYDTPPTSCTAPSSIEQTLTVNVSAPFDPLIHLPGFAQSYTLYGQAVQKRLQ